LAAQLTELQRGQRRAREGWQQCRRHTDRLVNLLWRSVPADSQRPCLSQRYILERLHEEVARSNRHGSVFTVAVGEVQGEGENPKDEESDSWLDWLTATVARAKRRCDVAGHYGLRGLMLLMVHTPAAGAEVGCRRLQQALEEAAPSPPGPRGPVRACFGLATFAGQGSTPQSLLSRAERHLQAARAGTSRGVVADGGDGLVTR
jgi:GGDEF domain-containing protein